MARYVLAVMFLTMMTVAVVKMQESPECGENQIWSLCGQMCEPTCDNPNPNPLYCPSIECTRFTASCRCQTGYLRNNTSSCVSPDDC
ncbi:chymotrypsin inhibitor-like [Ptiloglossa arizonensis]|uniref:chymotrypsin inhibitor-like n=1 Tax=Ptiloglossa arizonensis TaxID=3350558 RepID=UPI003F9F862D